VNQSQVAGKVFSAQNWLKSVGSVSGEMLVASTVAGMIGTFQNGAAILEMLRIPAEAFFPRWSAD
jgi:hypothetical protein